MSAFDRPDTSAFTTILDVFLDTAAKHPDKGFLCVPPHEGRDYYPDGVEFTYRQARARVEELQGLYTRSGVGSGHRVAFLLGNRPDHFFHLLALNGLGASVVPLNQDGTQDEMLYLVNHSEADFGIAAGSRRGDLEAVAKRAERGLAVYVADDLPAQLAAPARPASADRPARATQASLLYTSGTTGKPKGCIITNEYFISSGAWYLSRGGCLQFQPGDRLFNPFPVFHMNSGVISLMAMMLSGNTLISADRFHPRTWWRDVAVTRATQIHYMGVIPPVLLKQAPDPAEKQHQVRFGMGAGQDPVVHVEFEKRFGFPMVEVWGMTESGRILCDNVEPRKIDTRAIGRPVEGLEIKVVDDQDNPVPVGEPGQMLARFAGPDPRKGFYGGYFKEPKATEDAWKGGWFHTGDIVRQDPDGMLYFVDRRKNIIRRSGENIAAAEIEEILIGQPGVAQVAVLAVPCDLRDEEVMACVVTQAGTPPSRELAEALFQHCYANLAYYKAPGWLVFRDTLPVTSTTKIQKTLIFGPDEEPTKVAHCYDFRDRKKRKA